MEHNEEYYEKLIRLAEESDGQETLSDEFSNTGNPDKPFRFEHAFESITQRGSRFKRNRNEY